MGNITLIGMPGSGKSTIGKLLAEKLGWNFLDLDLYISEKENKSVGEILKEKGDKEFLKLEEFYALKVPLKNTVFAPGGSIIYLDKVMARLKKESVVIFINAPFLEIQNRLDGLIENKRGVVGMKGKELIDVYNERLPLYRRWADHSMDSVGSDPRAVLKSIEALLGSL